MYKIYTDGSSLKNGQENSPTGWGIAIYNAADEELAFSCGHIPSGTNNIGELIAILEALSFVGAHPTEKFEILSDSAYAINGLTSWMHSWRKADWTRAGKELKNAEIWKALYPLYMDNKDRFVFQKVKGHSGVKGNERVDSLAGMGAKGINWRSYDTFNV